MNPLTQNILNDIFMIEPELKQYEKEITNIVEKLLLKKPDTKFDALFAEKLKQELMAKLPAQTPFWRKLYLPQFSLPIIGVAGLLILAVLLPDSYSDKIFKSSKNYSLGFKSQIIQTGQNAFGKLTANNENQTPVSYNAVTDTASESSGRTALGLGGGGTALMTDAAPTKMSSTMMPYYPINYAYQYVGGDIVLPEENLAVYKKEKNNNVSANLSRVLSGFDFNLVSLNKFADSQIDSFVLSENREFGYVVYFNLLDNIININSNWRTWPQYGKECQDEACYKKYQLTKQDVPSDNELITITDNFVKQYGLDMNSYDTATVNQNQNLYYYGTREGGAEEYVPEIFNVLYPLKINNLNVYETSGEPTGLAVSVNIRYKKVSDVNNIVPADYLSSEYELEKDTTKLVARAEQGGFYPSWRAENAEKTITIKLGDPKIGLVKYYQYNQEKDESYELYLPALIFPVTNYGEEGIYQKSITVPLVKEILAENDQDNGGGIRPLITPDIAPMIKTETVRQ